MDIENLFMKYLSEGGVDNLGGAQIGKRLFIRYRSCHDLECKVDTLFLLVVLLLSLITKDRSLMGKSKIEL